MLELGCGNGRVTSALGEVAHSVIGVESHPGMRALALNETDGLANVTIMDGDMSDMGDWGLFQRIVVPFTGLFCLDRPALVNCLKGIHDRLEPGGVLSFDVYPPEIYHESDVDTVPYEWRTDIELGDHRWAVEEEIIVRRKEQEIAVSYRHFRNEDALRVDGPTYTIKHHYVLSHEWSPLLYAAGFEDWFFWGDLPMPNPMRIRSSSCVGRPEQNSSA